MKTKSKLGLHIGLIPLGKLAWRIIFCRGLRFARDGGRKPIGMPLEILDTSTIAAAPRRAACAQKSGRGVGGWGEGGGIPNCRMSAKLNDICLM